MREPLRILVVDEEPMIGEVIRAAVEDFGYEVTAVRDEQEAISALREPCHLLLLHRGLPDAACHELVRLARQWGNPAVVLLSSQKSRAAEQNMLRLGAAEILYKPLDPLEIRASIQRHGTAEVPDSEVLGGPRILVVDDDAAVLMSVQDILEEQYEVTATTSPYEALRLLRASPFEILLADLMMDELPGIELIRAARNTRPDIQALVMTGYASKTSAIAALKEGVNDFLEKPLTPELVRQTVARVWKSMRYELENRRLLTALRDQVAESQRLITELEARNAEIERFTYTVSHDLRSPLVTIKAFLGYVLQHASAGDQERLVVDVQRIAGAADRMHRLLDEILELSRIGRRDGQPQKVPLTEVAGEAAEGLGQELSERGIALDVSPELPIAIGDRERLREIFHHLIGNAMRFMGDQSTPRIEVAVKRLEPSTDELSEESTNGDRETVIYVRDNGIGIESRYHERIFDLFEQLDPQASAGTGIGLALVKRMVEIHGGRIWVESEGKNLGSAFYFTLPFDAFDAEAPTPSNPS